MSEVREFHGRQDFFFNFDKVRFSGKVYELKLPVLGDSILVKVFIS